MTRRMTQIMDMRAQRWSYRRIANALGISHVAAWQTHQRAIANMSLLDLPTDIPPPPDVATRLQAHLRRAEEVEFVEARITDYLEIFELSKAKGRLSVAVQALDGMHRYLETLLKLQGVAAPDQVQHTISIGDLQKQLKTIEGELAGSDVSETTDADTG